jgi:hypothetical protein
VLQYDNIRVGRFYYTNDLSRPVAGVLGAESAVLGVYVRLKREERSEELETRYRVRHARAESCDYDVTT